MHTQKIATCCYCGARTILRLTARDGHELACGSCGAPLHVMKPIRTDRHPKPRPHGPRDDIHGPARRKPGKKRKPRKAARFWDILEEVVDVVEDILD